MEASLEANLLKKLLSGEIVQLFCEILESEEVVMGPDEKVVSAQVLKKLEAQPRRPSLVARFKKKRPIYINLENVRIEDNLVHPIKGISFITQDPDDKTIFGYVCSQPCRTGFKLYIFKSNQARDIIKILNKALEVANTKKEERSSKECLHVIPRERNVFSSGGNYIRSVDNTYGLEVGSLVEVPRADGFPRYGVIRWIGNLPQVTGKLVAGLELEEEQSSCSDGTFNKERFFICSAGRGFFVLLENCRPDSRFDQPPTEEKEQKVNVQGMVRELEEQMTHSKTELREKELRETNVYKQQWEEEQREEDFRKQWHEMEQQLTNLRGQLQERNEQLRDVNRQMTVVQEELYEKYVETANLQNQATALRQQQEKKDQEMDEQLTNLRGLLQEKNEQLRDVTQQTTIVQGRLREKDEEIANSQNQATSLRHQLEEKDQEMEQQLTNLRELLQERNEQLRDITQRMKIIQGRLCEKDEETANLQNQATALRHQLVERDQEMELQLTNLRGQLQERNEQLRDVTQQMTGVQGRLQEKDEETANLQNQLEEKDQEMSELEATLSTVQDELRDYQRQQSPEWVISRNHIQLTDKFLGRGGWGSVVEGKYCGCSVAVKQIHELILSPHNRKLFEREIDIASKCRHPCLLQFIGATNDKGNPLLVTELMETSLRTLLEQRALSEVEISFISLDVARALNYLHQKQPSPIIHRDISSANVLLWRQGEHWRGKVSDYGTANFKQQTMSAASGAVIYSAPEAFTKVQTIKVDVFSFGVLLCEMCIQELPDPERRARQVAMVKNKLNRALIRGCLESEPEARPSIQEVIDELEEPN